MTGFEIFNNQIHVLAVLRNLIRLIIVSCLLLQIGESTRLSIRPEQEHQLELPRPNR